MRKFHLLLLTLFFCLGVKMNAQPFTTDPPVTISEQRDSFQMEVNTPEPITVNQLDGSDAIGAIELGGFPLSIWAGVLIGLLEILARVVPTSKDWSVTGFIYKVVNFIVPNRTINGEAFRIRKQ
jgi:hypothetical protein